MVATGPEQHARYVRLRCIPKMTMTSGLRLPARWGLTLRMPDNSEREVPVPTTVLLNEARCRKHLFVLGVDVARQTAEQHTAVMNYLIGEMDQRNAS
jgi:hypothetical protein